jgi:hypothetical protein
MLARRHIRKVLLLGVGCCLFMTPWIWRTVLVSGYLFFPLSAIDLFNVPWKLPLKDTIWHENAVKLFALGADLNKPFTMGIEKWFPVWASGLDFIRQVILGTAFMAFAAYCGIAVRQLWRRDLAFFSRNIRPVLFVVTGTAGVIFWLLKAPDFRFGYGFLIFYDSFFLVFLSYYFLEGYFRYIVAPVILYMLILTTTYYRGTWMNIAPFFGAPIPYRMPAEIRRVKIPAGKTAEKRDLYLVMHDDSWNAALPVANDYEFGGLAPAYLGSTVREGFMSTQK